MPWSGLLGHGGALSRVAQPTGTGEYVRRRVVSAYVNAHCPVGGRVVDLGAGRGYLRSALRPDLRSRYTVVDALGGPHGTRIVGDVTAVPLASGAADVVCLSDVLEHLACDGDAVAEAVRVARPGGLVVVHVPSGRAKPYAFLRRAAEEAEAADRQQFPHVRDGYTQLGLETLLAGVADAEVVTITPSFTTAQSLISDVDEFLWWRKWTVLRLASWLGIRIASSGDGRATTSRTSSGYLAVLQRRSYAPVPVPR